MAAGALVVLVAGCGDGGPKLATVIGTVNYKGAPVQGANVTFLFSDGQMATGQTGADGKFELTTGGRPGAPMGQAKVGIAKSTGGADTGTSQPKPEDMAKMFAKMAGKDGSGMKDGMKVENELPAKYALPDTSGLSADIKASGNDFKYDLVD